MKSLASRLLAAVALLAIPATASAHRAWLLPSTTTVTGSDNWVSVDAAISNDLFDADHFPMQTSGIKVTRPDGTPGEIQNAAQGRYRSTFDVKLDKEGTWKIGTSTSTVGGSFKLNGETWTIGRRRGPPAGGPGEGQMQQPPAAAAPNAAPARVVATVADIPAGATDIKLSETNGRNEIFVTAGVPNDTVLQLTGKGLEFDPQTHPADLVSNEPAKFRFLIDGKPAAGLRVTLVPGGKRFRDSESALDLTTGADGMIEVKWPIPGMYWLNVSASDANGSVAKGAERRMTYTTTLEVPAP